MSTYDIKNSLAALKHNFKKVFNSLLFNLIKSRAFFVVNDKQ